MKKILILIVFCLSIYESKMLFSQNTNEKNSKIKNVIVMIPDGTSTSILSIARWYQYYLDNSKQSLAFDSLNCGMVKTHSSNVPIGDSAPTSSWYATGVASKSGFVATYPPKDSINDLVYINPKKQFQPLLTVLEAAKLSGKKTGLVFTCEFPHATPADFSAHSYSRGDYDAISKQMVYNNIDVVFGGGEKFIKQDERDYLKNNGWDTIFNDYSRFKSTDNDKVWALFGAKDLPFDIDRNPLKIPSLSEMTAKALSVLSKNNDKGFFMMVEGSKVDWAAHSNDPVGIITEFLAFNKAVETVLKFTNSGSGETVVVILPDHGNSGISLGNKNSNKSYDELTLSQIIDPLLKWKLTAEGFSKKILQNSSDDSIKYYFKKYYTDGEISPSELVSVKNSVLKGKYGICDEVAKIIASKTYIGFTTTGHTGEDVFLAVYNPYKDRPTGIIRGDAVNKYLCKMLGNINLSDSTEKYFQPHNILFKGLKSEVVQEKDDIILKVTNNEKILEIPAYKNIAFLNGKAIKLNSVTVYVDLNNTFYLPESLGNLIK
ncbi:MAG: alkaline phosphatase [Bacteroidetes bacterium]|nr:alkaline phosphatase [Bacteroidota bacterium]